MEIHPGTFVQRFISGLMFGSKMYDLIIPNLIFVIQQSLHISI